MNEYNICFSLDSNYTEQACVSIASVLAASDKTDKIKIYILNGGLSAGDKDCLQSLKKIKDFEIEYIKMNLKAFASCPMLKDKEGEHKDYHVTLPTYFRFMLPEVIQNEECVLYLDCDVIVQGRLKELFSLDIKNKAAAMVLDAETQKEAGRLGIKNYFNAGVMLINLDYWRRNNIQKKLFDYAEKNKSLILWQDQDILNSVLAGSIKEIPNIWNYQYFQYDKPDAEAAADAVILHLAGRFKPWLTPFESEIYDEYYKYLQLTPFKNRIIKYRLEASGKRLKNNTGGGIANIASFIEGNTADDTDKKISKVYEEISKNYKYTNDKAEELKKEALLLTDEKISKVYDEITKNYKYTNDKAEEAKNQAEKETLVLTDEKISKVYDEITKNYKYTNDKAEEAKNEALQLISRKTDEQNKKLKEKLETDINSLTGRISAGLKEQKAAFDENILEIKQENQNYTDNKLFETQEKILKYTDETKDRLKNLLEQRIEEKNILLKNEFSNVSADLEAKLQETEKKASLSADNLMRMLETKSEENRNYAQNIKNELSGSISEINQNFTKNSKENEEKISAVKNEILKSSEYTEFLVQTAEEKLKNAVSETKNEVIGRLNTETENANLKFDEIKTGFQKFAGRLKSEVQETNLKFSEVYSYTNKNISNIYNHINSSVSAFQENLSAKISDVNKAVLPLDERIARLKKELEKYPGRTELDALNAEFSNKIEEKNALYTQIMDKIKAEFDEKLNDIRVQYEKKLIKSENKINELSAAIEELRSNPAVRLAEKLRKKQ